MIAELSALDPDERVPVKVNLERLRGAVALTGDLDIGLKAAREVSIGDAGAIEHMASAAPNVRTAIEILGRYTPLINEALEFSLHIEGDRAIVRLDSLVTLERAAVDYQLGAFYVAALHRRPLGATLVFDVLFTHARPERVDEYERTFAPGRLCFGAAFDGFAFDRRYLDLPLPSVDPTLHGVLRDHAERVLAALPRAQSFTEKVRGIVVLELASGNSSAARTAALLHVSRRTLGRKLRLEGTSFTELLEDVRRHAALRYVARRDLRPVGDRLPARLFGGGAVSPRVQTLDRTDAARVPPGSPRLTRARRAAHAVNGMAPAVNAATCALCSTRTRGEVRSDTAEQLHHVEIMGTRRHRGSSADKLRPGERQLQPKSGSASRQCLVSA